VWRPRTESEIQVGVENGAAVESATFDAKSELPAAGKNKDLAKDICAMTVDGGTLLYGLGGEDRTRPDTRMPFAMQGARERIDSVAESAIAEPPQIDIYEIDSDEHPGTGYLCVTVPPSPRAPHMLTLDDRYWGRSPSGNRILTEGEVARLYERRERWEVDRAKLLSDVLAGYPFTFSASGCGVVLVLARPVASGRELLRQASGSDIPDFLMHEVSFAASRNDPFPGYGAQALSSMRRVRPLEADLWLCTAEPDLASEYQAHGEFSSNGGLVYWQSPILKDHAGAGRIWIAEHAAERAVSQALGVAAHLYQRAGFFGAVDVGIAVLGIAGCRGITTLDVFGAGDSGYGAAEYRRSERVTAIEMEADLDGVVGRLLGPLFEVISRRGYEPLGEREAPRH
jgi:hypothetical protein